LFDESAVPGEVVGDPVGSASVTCSVPSAASLFGRKFGGETIFNIGGGWASWGGGFWGGGFASGRGGRRDGNFFLGGTDFDLVFCGGCRLGSRNRFGYGKGGRFRFLGRYGFRFGSGFGSGWGGGWFGLFRRGGLRGGILDFRFLIRNFGWRLRGGGLRRGGSGRWKTGAWA